MNQDLQVSHLYLKIMRKIHHLHLTMITIEEVKKNHHFMIIKIITHKSVQALKNPIQCKTIDQEFMTLKMNHHLFHLK
jgi:hypothetical protein